MIINNAHLQYINSPVRQIKARVELLNNSTLLNIFNYTDALKSFTVERVGESKFFGFGICQKLNVKLMDVERKINITTDNTLDVAFGIDSDYIYTLPIFKVTEVNRDENTNELSVTAYDALNLASQLVYDDLGISTPYTINQLVGACGAVLGVPVNTASITDGSLDTLYPTGANFEGTETVRDVLNAIAEATQSIYFINSKWELEFKRLDVNGNSIFTVDKEKYFTLDSKTNRRLGVITHTTDLGDNITAELDVTGSTQYVRNNPFWDLRNDIDELINKALAAVGGLTINQFDCKWRGNYLLELGDKIEFTTKDGNSVYSYLLDDSIEYNGAFAQASKWSYADDSAETASNPSTLGEALKQTFARVDKANKNIEMLVSETDGINESVSALLINTDSINASVHKIEENTNQSFEEINNDLEIITNKVNATMTPEDIKLEIQTELNNGVESVKTNTGFTFDDTGLKIEKSDSEVSTLITEDGMTVNKNNEEMLVANNEGVRATNLHATTYLIIGNYSRFEDYIKNGEPRTGCFWIGGND